MPNGIIDYEAQTISKNSILVTEEEKKGHLAEHVAIALYGCIFQTLYLKTISDYNFDCCFSLDQKSNGQKDAKSFLKMNTYINNRKRLNIKEHTESIYIPNILEDTCHLDKLFGVKIERLIEQDNKIIFINMSQLSEDIESFLIEHEKFYKNYIKSIKEIISTK